MVGRFFVKLSLSMRLLQAGRSNSMAHMQHTGQGVKRTTSDRRSTMELQDAAYPAA
jgi:hypothetical protein